MKGTLILMMAALPLAAGGWDGDHRWKLDEKESIRRTFDVAAGSGARKLLVDHIHGFVHVTGTSGSQVQDVRGRYTSEGEWYTFKHEMNDGYDTVEGAAALPHSNGKVGMFGGSYVGATQMLAAISHPPHLAGICPVV